MHAYYISPGLHACDPVYSPQNMVHTTKSDPGLRSAEYMYV